MSAVKVTKVHPLAKPGEPWVPVVRIPVGEHALSKYPDWAIARLVELGHAELVVAEEAETDPEAAAALAAAKAEQEAMDAEVKAKAGASASAAKSQTEDKGGRGGGK